MSIKLSPKEKARIAAKLRAFENKEPLVPMEKVEKIIQTSILPNPNELPKHSHRTLVGIYFLYQGSELVYVGKSENVLFRLGQHSNNPEKVFDSYNYYECDFKDLNQLEAYYIKYHQPKFNKVGLKNKHRKGIKINYNHYPEVDKKKLKEEVRLINNKIQSVKSWKKFSEENKVSAQPSN